MIAALIFSTLFLAASIYNVSTGAFGEALAGLVISLALLGLYAYNRRQERNITDFLLWLDENKDVLNDGHQQVLQYQNVPVSINSCVTQYQFCASFLIVTFKQSTGYYLDKSADRWSANIFTTLFSLIFGWWGIPWGPVYTVQSVFRNMRGGHKQSISDLIAAIESA